MARRGKARKPRPPHRQPCESVPASSPLDTNQANTQLVARPENLNPTDDDPSNPFTMPPKVFLAGHTAHMRAKRERSQEPLILWWKVRHPGLPKPRGGRPKKIIPETLARLHDLKIRKPGASREALAKELGVSRATLYRALQPRPGQQPQ